MPLLFMLALFTVLGLTGNAWADSFEARADGWVAYIGDDGTRLAFPGDVFSPGVSEKTASGRTFVAEDAKLEVLAWPNINGWSAKALEHDLLRKPEYSDVTYSPSGSSWLVMSGYRGDRIFYEKYLFRKGMLHAFSIEFPIAAKPFYAPIVEHMEDTFRIAPDAQSLRPVLAPQIPSKNESEDARRSRGGNPLVIY
jgi:hypothetical protein